MFKTKCACGGELFLHKYRLFHLEKKERTAPFLKIPILSEGFCVLDDPKVPKKYWGSKHDLSTTDEQVICEKCQEVSDLEMEEEE